MNTMKLKIWLIIGLVIVSTLACAIPGVTTSFTLNTELDDKFPEIHIEPPTIEEIIPPNTWVIPDSVLLQDNLVQLYESVSPGVVSIQVYSDLGSGLGSGFVIDQEGHIVTNYHVVEVAREVEVHFPSGLKVYGEVIGVDLDSDLAVIKVDVDPDDLHPLPLGDSDQLRVGQTVVAIGNPFGLSGTMTVGIVSARGRTLESIRQTEGGAFFTAGDLIQTDASINPGNSGGPLLNLNGEVIGINRALRTSGNGIFSTSSNTGIGFAVSSNIVKRVVPTLKKGLTFDYPYLGLSSLESLTLANAELLGLPTANGAYVLDVVPGGPADKAGLKAGSQATQVAGLYAGGDLIIRVDNVDVLEFSDLLSYLMLNKNPGETMDMVILRNGEEKTITITLGKRPSSAP
ncbi:MAG: putative periplasmic serine endoprotease DegP-like precursor [Chloroflexi bacterium ADurb.Bin120]|jgi:2-alkenal reductase|uniref:Putative S1B family peptidase n=1 Tax=Candidatus Brevifilum fermentans TaxID=1986204 RepID=A0A1Y6K134_9CHLR|nr:trypsin-like peptidase domain-containing protein [Brevefilum fermentans]MDI9566217.1 trypsin-like peptidase domain-containing protein [Chloroflexota bacterium]OQB87957.1 MAG: putative periplasmic serine endoprotease DegP-like precursor [Chloroflexi bacterium ADurb.Bin120]SMX53395.1 putative S1B family peptidase [Brevefilum fermentans]HOM67167.1 trypsin-like peptidase domain-containing protein [Brevefilum fermentans]